MFSKKIILILFFLIMTTSLVFAVPGSIEVFPKDKNISAYSSNYSIQFYINNASFPEEINIRSDKNSTGIDFNYSSSPGTAIISTSATVPYIDSTDLVPVIPVNMVDTIIISSKQDGGINDTLKSDSVLPINNAVLSISALNQNYGSFYSGAIRVGYTGSTITDGSGTGIFNHLIYVVPVSDLSDYSEDYEDMNVNTGGAGALNFDINSLRKVNNVRVIPDGNYYVVIDANDYARNYSSDANVLATKKNVYFDNTAPTLTKIEIDSMPVTLVSNKAYIKVKRFSIGVFVDDVSGISSNTDSNLFLIMPNISEHIAIDSNYDSKYYISATDLNAALHGYEPETGDTYRAYLTAKDKVGNILEYDFNILIDLTAPPAPATNVITIEDIDKNTTISWTSGGADTGGSGFQEYKVYKDDSNFTTITNQELVCTTTSTSCVDSDDKSLDDTIYYGVVAIDKSGNLSAPRVSSIWTGPAACSFTINDDEEFTNNATVNLDIDLPSDVNAMGVSCNNGSPTAIAADDNASFNLTTGTGCSTTNEEKTIYVKVISEDYPTRFSVCSNTIFFDNAAPTTPTNLKSTAQSDGSVKLTWTESTESVEPDTVKYRVYYSTSSNLTNTADYKESITNTYTFSSNQDINLYFKVSAIDLRNNESALSSSVLANVRKIGPRFSITVDPSNDVNGEIYVNSGTKTIEFISDETLSGNPQVTIKKASSSSYDTVSSTYDSTTKKGSATIVFVSPGTNIVKITGTNTKNETASSELEIIMDSTAPDFNYGHELADPVTFDMWVSNLSSDVYKVEYLVDNNTVICSKQQVTDYNCNNYDLRETPDGNHTMYINVYDKALNKKTKTFSYEIDLVDEDKVECDNLRDEIAAKLKQLEEDLDLFTAIGLINTTLEQTINDKKTIVFTKRSEGNDKYIDENYSFAKADYQFSINEIQAIDDLLPDIEVIKSTTIPIIYDANVLVSLEEIMDQNTSLKTKQLYDSNIIKIDRNFEILKIGSQNFFSVKLIIKNTSAASKEITIVENIPKSFANNVSKLVFNKEVEILVKDPVIKYTLTIPSKGSEEIIYRSLTPVTAVDATTKYNLITESFNTKLPLVIDGNVSTELLDIKKPINMNIIIYFVIIILLLVITVLIIGAINNYKNKQVEIKPDTKKIMNDYLGKTEKDQQKADKTQDQKKAETSQNKTSEPEEPKKKDSAADKFNEDYQYILSAIKKR